MIDTTLCFECGADTQYDGFVNRISCGRDNLECYKCGPCNDTEEEMTARSAEDFDDDKWDAYLARRIKYVDTLFPDAPKFRAFMETEEDWSATDITKVTTLINSYRRKHYNA